MAEVARRSLVPAITLITGLTWIWPLAVAAAPVHLAFDECGGRLALDRGGGAPATVYGADRVPGLVAGGALRFSGRVETRVVGPPVPLRDAFSVELWMVPEQVVVRAAVVAVNYGFELWLERGVLRFAVFDRSSGLWRAAPAPRLVQPGELVHVLATYDPRTRRACVALDDGPAGCRDGVTSFGSSSGANFDPTWMRLAVGYGFARGDLSSPFAGVIDELRVLAGAGELPPAQRLAGQDCEPVGAYVADEHTALLLHLDDGAYSPETRVTREEVAQIDHPLLGGTGFVRGLPGLGAALYIQAVEGQTQCVRCALGPGTLLEPGSGPLTVEAVVQPARLDGQRPVLDAPEHFELLLDDGHVVFALHDAAAMRHEVRTAEVLQVDVARHVAATWDPDAGALCVHVDGAEARCETLVDVERAPVSDDGARLFVGYGKPGGEPAQYAGVIDEVRVSRVVRDPLAMLRLDRDVSLLEADGIPLAHLPPPPAAGDSVAGGAPAGGGTTTPADPWAACPTAEDPPYALYTNIPWGGARVATQLDVRRLPGWRALTGAARAPASVTRNGRSFVVLSVPGTHGGDMEPRADLVLHPRQQDGPCRPVDMSRLGAASGAAWLRFDLAAMRLQPTSGASRYRLLLSAGGRHVAEVALPASECGRRQVAGLGSRQMLGVCDWQRQSILLPRGDYETLRFSLLAEPRPDALSGSGESYAGVALSEIEVVPR
jgi:hypothetical protein